MCLRCLLPDYDIKISEYEGRLRKLSERKQEIFFQCFFECKNSMIDNSYIVMLMYALSIVASFLVVMNLGQGFFPDAIKIIIAICISVFLILIFYRNFGKKFVIDKKQMIEELLTTLESESPKSIENLSSKLSEPIIEQVKKEVENNKPNMSVALSLLALLLAILAIYIAFPVQLSIIETVDENNGRLVIYVMNKDLIRPSGNIILFKLENNPYKPSAIARSIGVGENATLFNLSIKVRYENISLGSEEWLCMIPYQQLYYITEKTSISYRVTCDNCPPEGYYRRIPNFQTVSTAFGFDNKTGKCFGQIPVYSWIDFNLSDVQ